MTNGAAFVYDPDGQFDGHINRESVEIRHLESDEATELQALIQRHVEATGSAHAQDILDRWSETSGAFWRVVPTAVLELQLVAEESAKGAAD
jgi:glutamate synthase (NADPH/NADH) large chain